MPIRVLSLSEASDQLLLQPQWLEAGSLPWLLAHHSDLLCPPWLVRHWRGQSATGRPAWPAAVLFGLLLLRHEAGLSRVASLRQAKCNVVWRAALRLPWRMAPPDEKTMREFEAWLQSEHWLLGVPYIVVFFEHWVRLCLQKGVLGEQTAFVVDSTPMDCYGAVLDTLNLLGEGLRALARRWARERRVPLALVAQEWDAPWLLSKSTKGHFEDIDWSETDHVAGVLFVLATAVVRGTQQVHAGLSRVRPKKRAWLAQRCTVLLRVVAEDLETASDGRLRVAVRTSSERLISLLDPDAQHFRKSKSQVCTGFKLHVLGEIFSGLILSLAVTPGGQHDSTPAAALIGRAKQLHQTLSEVLGDSAYGGMPVRQQVAAHCGVSLLSPPPPAQRGEELGKSSVDIDFETMRAVCPGGCSSARWKFTRCNGQSVPTLYWTPGSEKDCTCAADCPVHRPRVSRKGQRRAPRRCLPLHPQEQQLRELRARWQQPQTRRRYRDRSQGERLMRVLTRRGCRRAASWGLPAARLQAYAAAGANNVRLLARCLATQDPRIAA